MSRKLTKTYVFEIPANGFRNAPIWGNYFRVKAITSNATVTIESDDGDRVEGIGIAQSFKFDEQVLIENAIKIPTDTIMISPIAYLQFIDPFAMFLSCYHINFIAT